MLIIFRSMNIKDLKTEEDYEDALERLDQIFDAPENTPEGD
jgi:HTH-type transcriptional regulator / antitoxin HigA